MNRLTLSPIAIDLPRRQSGLSLVELMTALTISLLLLIGLTTLVINSNQNFQELTRSSQQMENGRFAMQLLKEDLRLAGFYGELANIPAAGATLPDPCVVGDVPAQRAGISRPVQGFTSAASLSCITNTDHVAGTDILVVRRASTSTDMAPGYLHIQATPRQFILGTDATTYDLTWGLATDPEVRPYFVHIYYISPNSVGNDGIPSLKRIEIRANNFNTVPLVEGIENMQFLYGVDTTGNGSPDSYVNDPTTIADWADVVTVQAFLLVRNLEATQGYSDDKSYTLGDVDIAAPGDAFKRHVYSTSVRLTNPAGRRE